MGNGAGTQSGWQAAHSSLSLCTHLRTKRMRSTESSRSEKQINGKGESMRTVVRTLESMKRPLSPDLIAQIEALKAMPDREIDYSDIPPLPDDFMKRAKPLAEVFPKLAAAMVEVRQARAREERKAATPQAARPGKAWVGPAPDTRALREQLGLTQEQFAARFGLSLRALHRWESGERAPGASARALLRVIAHSPDLVAEALQGSLIKLKQPHRHGV